MSGRTAEPTPIPDGLLPVKTFDPDLLPASISPWALDIADRMQCPLDFIGISALAALGAVLGRKVAIRPKQKDCWACVANFWAMVIGKPGVMKSPAMEQAIKPPRRLEMKAAKAYAMEELVAEIGAAFLCADLGITPETRDDHAAYIAVMAEKF